MTSVKSIILTKKKPRKEGKQARRRERLEKARQGALSRKRVSKQEGERG